MTNGINTDGFAQTNPPATNNIDGKYSPNPKSAFPAKDVSTQGKAGFNAEGSYDNGTSAESNAYPESENM